MHARRALLKSLASVGRWEASELDEHPQAFDGHTAVETRNTVYRFRDGVCFAVAKQRDTRRARGSALIGMRIVGWLVTATPDAPKAKLTRTWQPGACAVLFRPCAAGGDDGAMALTSPTVDFTNGLESTRLQAFHDVQPPSTSDLYRREAPAVGGQGEGRSPFAQVHGRAARRTRIDSQSGG